MIAYSGDKHQVIVRAKGSDIFVEVQPKGPLMYTGIGPFYRVCSAEPKVWWKPGTWFRRDPVRAVRDAVRWCVKEEKAIERGNQVIRSLQEVLND